MANGKITKELKELGLKINGVEPNGDTTSELINSIADDYTGGSSTGVYVCDFLENSDHVELTEEQMNEFISNITNPNVISKFSSIAGSGVNISIIAVDVEVGEVAEDILFYNCVCYFNNYLYTVDLDVHAKELYTNQP